MNVLIRAAIAIAAATAAGSLLAAGAIETPSGDTSAHVVASAAIRERMAKLVASKRISAADEASAGAGIDAVNATGSGPRVANATRSYPPSCLADPLPDTPSGPTTTFQMQLYTRDNSGNGVTAETVTISIWRMACSSSGNLAPYNIDGLDNAALLMRIARSNSNNGHTDFFPTFPSLTSTQGNTAAFVRAAMEPNTVVSDAPFDAPVYVSTTYVLENYPYAGSGYTYFNNDFALVIDPAFDNVGTGAQQVNILGYQPDQNSYPAAFQNLPIDGYMSTAWYDTAHGGEGLMVQVYDNADHATRTLFAAWYTYDDNGIPFWLAIQGVAAYGAKSFSNVPVYYYTGGGFAGNFNSVTQHTWGTMNISFSDCTTMSFDFNGSADAIAGGPGGSGSRTWHRLAEVNGLNCE